jgi:hypothetical protein
MFNYLSPVVVFCLTNACSTFIIGPTQIESVKSVGKLVTLCLALL